MQLKDYLSGLGRGGHKEFAEKLGISMSYLSQIASKRCAISPQMCVKIELASDSNVSRIDLKPEDWQEIWPELAEKQKAS